MHFLPLQSGTNFRAQAFMLPSVTSCIPWFLSSNHVSSGSWPHLLTTTSSRQVSVLDVCIPLASRHWPPTYLLAAPLWHLCDVVNRDLNKAPVVKVAGSSRQLLTTDTDHPTIQASLQVGQCRLAESAAGRVSWICCCSDCSQESEFGAPETGVWNILDHPLWIWMLTLTCEIKIPW